MSLAQPTEIVKRQEVTRDAFLAGRLTLLQPARGFRAGLDSVLLGAAVGADEGALLDLGAGAGVAALVALAHRPGLTAVLAEADPAMRELAAQNIESNGLSDRAEVVAADVTAPGAARRAAGLATDHFATIIANPPFYDSGTAAAPSRTAARQMPADALDRWVRAAAAHAGPDGRIVFIHMAARLAPLLAAFETRFGAITVLPLSPRENEPASRILVRGIKGSRAPLTLLATRPLHEPSGRAFRPEFEAILRGTDVLHW